MLGWMGGVVALLMIMIAPAAAAADVEAGSVLALRGSCLVDAHGSKTALKPDDVVHVGDRIEVASGAKIKLRMVDGSVVAAGSGSVLTIERYAAGQAGSNRDVVMSLASGLLRAVVAKATQPSTFEVTTATGVAAVRSTDWFIEAKPGKTRVGVLKGTVVLTSLATRHEMRIPARWGSRVEAGRDPIPARIWTKAEFDDVIARTALE
jgi:hypothetical protein